MHPSCSSWWPSSQETFEKRLRKLPPSTFDVENYKTSKDLVKYNGTNSSSNKHCISSRKKSSSSTHQKFVKLCNTEEEEEEEEEADNEEKEKDDRQKMYDNIWLEIKEIMDEESLLGLESMESMSTNYTGFVEGMETTSTQQHKQRHQQHQQRQKQPQQQQQQRQQQYQQQRQQHQQRQQEHQKRQQQHPSNKNTVIPWYDTLRWQRNHLYLNLYAPNINCAKDIEYLAPSLAVRGKCTRLVHKTSAGSTAVSPHVKSSSLVQCLSARGVDSVSKLVPNLTTSRVDCTVHSKLVPNVAASSVIRYQSEALLQKNSVVDNVCLSRKKLSKKHCDVCFKNVDSNISLFVQVGENCCSLKWKKKKKRKKKKKKVTANMMTVCEANQNMNELKQADDCLENVEVHENCDSENDVNPGKLDGVTDFVSESYNLEIGLENVDVSENDSPESFQNETNAGELGEYGASDYVEEMENMEVEGGTGSSSKEEFSNNRQDILLESIKAGCNQTSGSKFFDAHSCSRCKNDEHCQHPDTIQTDCDKCVCCSREKGEDRNDNNRCVVNNSIVVNWDVDRDSLVDSCLLTEESSGQLVVGGQLVENREEFLKTDEYSMDLFVDSDQFTVNCCLPNVFNKHGGVDCNSVFDKQGVGGRTVFDKQAIGGRNVFDKQVDGAKSSVTDKHVVSRKVFDNCGKVGTNAFHELVVKVRHFFDKHGGSSDVSDKHVESSDVFDKHGGSSDVFDKHGGSSDVSDKHVESSDVFDKHGGSSDVFDKHGGSSDVSDKHVESSDLFDKHAESSGVFDKHAKSSDVFDENAPDLRLSKQRGYVTEKKVITSPNQHRKKEQSKSKREEDKRIEKEGALTDTQKTTVSSGCLFVDTKRLSEFRQQAKATTKNGGFSHEGLSFIGRERKRKRSERRKRKRECPASPVRTRYRKVPLKDFCLGKSVKSKEERVIMAGFNKNLEELDKNCENVQVPHNSKALPSDNNTNQENFKDVDDEAFGTSNLRNQGSIINSIDEKKTNGHNFNVSSNLRSNRKKVFFKKVCDKSKTIDDFVVCNVLDKRKKFENGASSSQPKMAMPYRSRVGVSSSLSERRRKLLCASNQCHFDLRVCLEAPKVLGARRKSILEIENEMKNFHGLLTRTPSLKRRQPSLNKEEGGGEEEDEKEGGGGGIEKKEDEEKRDVDGQEKGGDGEEEDACKEKNKKLNNSTLFSIMKDLSSKSCKKQEEPEARRPLTTGGEDWNYNLQLTNNENLVSPVQNTDQNSVISSSLSDFLGLKSRSASPLVNTSLLAKASPVASASPTPSVSRVKHPLSRTKRLQRLRDKCNLSKHPHTDKYTLDDVIAHHLLKEKRRKLNGYIVDIRPSLGAGDSRNAIAWNCAHCKRFYNFNDVISKPTLPALIAVCPRECRQANGSMYIKGEFLFEFLIEDEKQACEMYRLAGNEAELFFGFSAYEFWTSDLVRSKIRKSIERLMRSYERRLMSKFFVRSANIFDSVNTPKYLVNVVRATERRIPEQ